MQKHQTTNSRVYNPTDYLPSPDDPRYAEQCAQAIARAHRRGVLVLAHGHDMLGQRIYCVPSGSQQGQYHWVTQASSDGALHCDCLASVLCAHIGATLAYLDEESIRQASRATWAAVFAEHGYTLIDLATL